MKKTPDFTILVIGLIIVIAFLSSCATERNYSKINKGQRACIASSCKTKWW